MPSLIVSEIRSRLSDYIGGRISLRSFRDWFSPIAWDIESYGDAAAIDLAYFIDGLLSESTSANWSEQDLHQELASFMDRVSFSPNSVQDQVRESDVIAQE